MIKSLRLDGSSQKPASARRGAVGNLDVSTVCFDNVFHNP